MTRYKGVRIDFESEYGSPIAPGNYYLVRIAPERGTARYELRESPARGNMGSHPEVFDGWAGTTNGVAVFGEGAVRVTRDAAGRYRVRPITRAEMLASEEVARG